MQKQDEFASIREQEMFEELHYLHLMFDDQALLALIKLKHESGAKDFGELARMAFRHFAEYKEVIPMADDDKKKKKCGDCCDDKKKDDCDKQQDCDEEE